MKEKMVKAKAAKAARATKAKITKANVGASASASTANFGTGGTGAAIKPVPVPVAVLGLSVGSDANTGAVGTNWSFGIGTVFSWDMGRGHGWRVATVEALTNTIVTLRDTNGVLMDFRTEIFMDHIRLGLVAFGSSAVSPNRADTHA